MSKDYSNSLFFLSIAKVSAKVSVLNISSPFDLIVRFQSLDQSPIHFLEILLIQDYSTKQKWTALLAMHAMKFLKVHLSLT